MRRHISAKDFSQLYASLNPAQGLVKLVFLHHERKGAFDGFSLSFDTEHGLRAREHYLIKLEMSVSSRGALPHDLSSAH
jgi:hypothetical protein